MKGKTKSTQLHLQEHLTFYIYNIHACSMIRKENTNVFHGRIIHVSFHEHSVNRRSTKWKKKLTCVTDIDMWLHQFLAWSETMSLLFKEHRQKEIENRFLRLSRDTQHDHFPREIIILSLHIDLFKLLRILTRIILCVIMIILQHYWNIIYLLPR